MILKSSDVRDARPVLLQTAGLLPDLELTLDETRKDASGTEGKIRNCCVTFVTWQTRFGAGGREHRMMPVTANHAVFVLSFASAFFACYVGSQFLSSLLNTSGYDISGTIIGYEKQPENMSSQLVRDFSSNRLAQLVAIALAAVTSMAIFWKFSQSEFALAHVCAKRNEADVCLQSRRSQCWIPRTGKNSPS